MCRGFESLLRLARYEIGTDVRADFYAVFSAGVHVSSTAVSGMLIAQMPRNGSMSVSELLRGRPCQRQRVEDADVHQDPWTIHDLRRTFATIHASIGTPIHITERLLNHVSGTQAGIVSVYQRHEYLPELRKAVDAFEAHLTSILRIVINRSARRFHLRVVVYWRRHTVVHLAHGAGWLLKK